MAEPASKQSLLSEVQGDILFLTLNRPQRLNALDEELIGDLLATFERLKEDNATRIVVLRANGRAFCAGFDIKSSDSAPGGQNAGEILRTQRRFSSIVAAMRRCPQPIICQLNGAASGAGFALALASDIRLATPSVRMNAAFIRLGLGGCDIGVSYFLPRLIGGSRAAYYIYSGDFMSAEQGLENGLLLAVVPPDELPQRAEALAESLLWASPLGLSLTKDTLNASFDAPSLDAVLAMEDRSQALAAMGPDFAEGIRAFHEKRRPEYGK